MNIILCGYNWTGCKALKILKDMGCNIFVYTHKPKTGVPDLSALCRKWGIPYSFENISNSILPFKPDAIASIYYRYIIQKNIIEAANGKIFNLHPSLLPKYRGCSSVTWALINGETEYGYTYHYLDEGTDTGNILIQKRLAIEEWDTQLNLYERVMYESMRDFNNALEMVVKGEKGISQNHTEATYYKRGCPYDGQINEEWKEDKIDCFIRAMHYPPLPPAQFYGKNVANYEEYLVLKNQIKE